MTTAFGNLTVATKRTGFLTVRRRTGPYVPPVTHATVTDLGNGVGTVTVATVTKLFNGLASVAGTTVTDLGNGLASVA